MRPPVVGAGILVPGAATVKRRGWNAIIKRIARLEDSRTTTRIRYRRTAIAAGAGAWIRSKWLRGADVSGVKNSVATAQDQRLVVFEAAVGKANAWSKIVLVRVGQIASAGRVLTCHLNRVRRGNEVALSIEPFCRRGKDVVAQDRDSTLDRC